MAARRRRRSASRGREAALGIAMAVPAVAAVAGLVIYPLVRGLQTSLQSSALTGLPPHGVGLANYRDVLQDPESREAMVRTLEYVVFAVALELVIGLAVAVAVQRAFRGRGAVLAVLVLPWALPSVVSGILWRRIFDPDNGLLNSLLLKLHVIGEPHVWLASGRWAVFLITVVHAWGVVPLTALILLAGLQGISDDLYKASAVDGASSLGQFRHVTLPLVRPSVAVASVMGTLLALSIFDEIYVLNGKALNTRSILIQTYTTAFDNADFAHGTAFAFLLAGVAAICGTTSVLLLRRRTA